MFSYYGSKSKIVHLYPVPKFDLIIEPFAGSARYALRYFERDVILIDKYPKVIAAWRFLQQANEQDILRLPVLQTGEDLRAKKFSFLTSEEKNFLGFEIVTSFSPNNIVSKGNFNNWTLNRRKEIATQLYKIKHWQIIEGDYYSVVNQSATWFVDPPYVNGGHKYIVSNKKIDYQNLAQFCLSRSGQVIVCENSSAEWLPFQTLTYMQGANKKTLEMFWTNEKTHKQYSLF